MESLVLKDIPCYYDTIFNPLKTGLEIDMHEAFFDFLKIRVGFIEAKANLIKKLYGFDDLSFDLDKNFGFGNSIINNGRSNGVVKFFVPIPSLSVITEKECVRCKGSKEDPYLEDQKCLYCRGTGKEFKQDWTLTKKTVSSLCLFTELMRCDCNVELIKPSYKKQMISFSVFTNERFNAVGGEMSPLFCEYLRNHASRTSIENIQNAMNQVDYHIWGRERGEIFQAYVEKNGFLVFNSPNAGLCPVSFIDRTDRGVEFSSNDRPSFADVLVLTAGLFAACGQARVEL